jgi:hypothetical protein
VIARGLPCALVLALFAALPAAAAHVDSGARGDVTAGPVCPVESVPPEPQCAPRGFKTTIRVRTTKSTHKLVKKVQSHDDGSFKARLRPGSYVLEPASGSGGRPSCQSQQVRVKAHRFVRVHLDCDTGIR